MPEKKAHLLQARHNEALIEFLEGSPYPDWIVTGAFYAALHYIEAYFDTLKPPKHCRIHTQRDSAVNTLPGTRPVYAEYRNLKDLSQEARHYGVKLSPDDINTLVRPSLARIKKQLKQYGVTAA